MVGVYNDVLLSVVNLINKLHLYAPITIGPLPPNNGLSIAVSTSSTLPFLNKNAAVEMTAVVNGKHTDQRIVSDSLGIIHSNLTRRKEYPESDSWQITDIQTISGPNYLGREQNSQWLYGSSIKIKFFVRGD